jgi:hypothetical protein
MKRNRIQSTILHIAATLLLSCGFVKTAESIDKISSPEVIQRVVPDSPTQLGSLPCSIGKD